MFIGIYCWQTFSEITKISDWVMENVLRVRVGVHLDPSMLPCLTHAGHQSEPSEVSECQQSVSCCLELRETST